MCIRDSHHLLFFDPDSGRGFDSDKPAFAALVMTSANISEEPICRDNSEVMDRMAGIADAFLVHDRGIRVRCDDSVVTSRWGHPAFVRRSRGYAPMPVFLKRRLPATLAFGSEVKNTLCLAEGDRAYVSQHIGDLDNIPTLGFFTEAVGHFTAMLDISPKVYAYDLHPDYLSTKYCMKMLKALPEGSYVSAGIQHHHAHIASVMAEHGITSPVIGLAMDGTGYGPDGTVWGGEVLVTTATAYRRFAHFGCVPLPGGAKAVREGWRMAFSHLRDAFGDDWKSLDLPCLRLASRREYNMLDAACGAGLNAPLAGTLGRLFDAVASILDIRHHSAFEGQAAMMLETAAETGRGDALPFTITEDRNEPYTGHAVIDNDRKHRYSDLPPDMTIRCVLDYSPTVRALAERALAGENAGDLAAAFHETLAVSFADIAGRARDETEIDTVALSGGCFQNSILAERTRELLAVRGFTVMTNTLVPVNDGGLSLGQAYIAGSAVE